ncbi:MAG: NUDIX domain-containing protein [Rhodospirillales bacterium]|nr:NUDIX domain-containing protein [Rhodospirillales bacterium]
MTPTLKAGDVEIVEKTTPFEGHFRIDRYRLRHRLFEGGWSCEMTREIFERGHAVAVLPYDPDRDRVVLIEQFRVGAHAAFASGWFANDASPWMIESVAGIIEKGEDPEDVARREVREETGCTVSDLLPLFHYLPSPGGSSESVFLFCGRVDAPAVGGIHGISDEGEDIRAFRVSPEEAFALLDRGRIANAMTIIGLQWLRANRGHVRKRWLGKRA